MSNEIDNRNYEELSEALQLTQNVVYKDYLGKLSDYTLLMPDELLLDEDPKRCIRMFQLEQLTCMKNEDIFQKLSTVYNSATSLGCSVFLLIDAPGIDDLVNVYLGVRAPNYLSENHDTVLRTSYTALEKGLMSNFQGSKDKNMSASSKIPNLINEMFQDGVNYISSVSCIASIRNNEKTSRKEFIQGVEKLIDAMRGKTYTALFIADPVSLEEQASMRTGYEDLYSTLSSFDKSIWSYNESEGDSVMESLSHGISKTVTESVSHTQSHTFSHTTGTSNTISANLNASGNITNSSELSKSQTDTSPTGVSRAGAAINSLANLAAHIPAAAIAIPGVGEVLGVVKAVGVAGSAVGAAMQGSSSSHGIVESIGKSIGGSIGIGGGYAHSSFVSDTNSEGTADGTATSNANGTVDTSTEGKTHSEEHGKSLQIEMTNKSIVEILKRIDEQLERIKECEDYGAYSCGAYFLSSREENALLAANTYRALMIGEGSSIERGAVNIWNDENTVNVMKEYLRRFAHPTFAMPITDSEIGPHMVITPGTIVSGLELPLHLGLPTKSVVGLPVIDHAEFGRNVIDSSNNLKVGSLYHMGKVEHGISVNLDKEELTKHTFITGSTGSGKSNTVYMMLERLKNDNVKFLVVEPAKGEYKSVFGRYADVITYGTNPNIRDILMLRINPFRFPKHTHILEHLDRLVEIFNVCWPMYAAMPAILKDAVERAYIKAGWNLTKSVNKYDDELYPSFTDVLVEIKAVLDESDYSADNKGDYTGSLVTRIKSLTNGINGLIFNTDDIPDKMLFDQNVIVDLSRVGSTETKALIMGILVLKLQEYRMENVSQNSKLNHVTVLEEAHNLLKRTSTDQVTEGANLLGKSVEMIANSIAEMRTYGEGFIIADQAPGLLDMSVIRNTNTKIILRLPDFSDRDLVGKAAGLNDDQIVELTKLEKGVAAIYQSDWIEPILCKVDKYDGPENKYFIDDNSEKSVAVNNDIVSKSLLDCIMQKEIYRKGDRVDIRELKDDVLKSKLDTSVKCDFLEYLKAGQIESVDALRSLIYDFLAAGQAIAKSKKKKNIVDWVHSVAEHLTPSLKTYSRQQIDMVMSLIIYEQSLRDESYNDILCKFVQILKIEGGVY